MKRHETETDIFDYYNFATTRKKTPEDDSSVYIAVTINGRIRSDQSGEMSEESPAGEKTSISELLLSQTRQNENCIRKR